MKVPLVACAVLVVFGARPVRAQTANGQAVYREHCRTCHGATGKPTDFARRAYKTIPTFADAAFFTGRSQDSIVAVLTRGVGTGKDMRSFKNVLSRDEMIAVARYVRTLSTPAPKSP